MSRVVVTLYSDDDYDVEAPSGVEVDVRYRLAEGDTHCECGAPIFWDEDSDEWMHREAAYQVGDDHPVEPSEDQISKDGAGK